MSAKSKETTKTAHVMNLLRKNAGSAQTAEPAAQQKPSVEQSEPTAAQPKVLPAQHPIIASLNEEAAVSQEIKDALEQELLENEFSAPVVQPEQAPMPEIPQEPVYMEPVFEAFEEEPTEEEESASELSEEPEEPEEEPVDACVEVDTAVGEAAEESDLPVEEEPGEQHIPVLNAEVYNVIQVLVEESTEKYMTMFHVCTCPRCKADVRALALSNLQPKYVVMEEGEYLARMITYERQFHTSVAAQLMRACTAVLENPRHDHVK